MMQKYLSFTVGGLTLGVSMVSVVAIDQSDSLPVGSPDGVKLGTVPSVCVDVPLYNFSLLLGRGDARQESTGDVKYVIVRCEAGDIALTVDGVGQVMDAQEQDVQTLPPIFSDMEHEVFPELLRGPQGFIAVLNPDAVEGAVLVFQMEHMGALAPGIEADSQPEVDPASGVGSDSLEVDDDPFSLGVFPEVVCPPEGLQVASLSDHVAQAIGPELLERVVGRVVGSMIKAFESEMSDAQDEALPLCNPSACASGSPVGG